MKLLCFGCYNISRVKLTMYTHETHHYAISLIRCNKQLLDIEFKKQRKQHFLTKYVINSKQLFTEVEVNSGG